MQIFLKIYWQLSSPDVSAHAFRPTLYPCKALANLFDGLRMYKEQNGNGNSIFSLMA